MQTQHFSHPTSLIISSIATGIALEHRHKYSLSTRRNQLGPTRASVTIYSQRIRLLYDFLAFFKRIKPNEHGGNLARLMVAMVTILDAFLYIMMRIKTTNDRQSDKPLAAPNFGLRDKKRMTTYGLSSTTRRDDSAYNERAGKVTTIYI